MRKDPHHPRRIAGTRKYYATHPVDFISDWAMTYDPRRSPSTLPFLLFPRQVEYIEWLHRHYLEREDGLAEKTRDMGLTWLNVAFAVWAWTFHTGVKASFGSRKESLVDKLGDPDSILEKVRFLVDHFPAEMRPVGFDSKIHAGYLKILNPENGSAITGEAGDQIGRGGRSTIYFLDEAAFIERPDRVDAALSENSDVKIHVSTPNGSGNPFYRKRFGGIWDVFTFHWRDDPRKDEAWYADRVRKLDPTTRAQEIDIDYHASLERVIIPGKWVRAAVDVASLVDEWPEFGGGVGGLDVGGGGDGRSVYIARFGPFVDPPVNWGGGNTTVTAALAVEAMQDSGVDFLNFDVVGVGVGVASTLLELTKWPLLDDDGNQYEDEQGRKYWHYVRTNGINVGDPATPTLWPDGKRGYQKFANLKAEVWWLMRERFLRTYEHVMWLKGDEEVGQEHDLSDLIIIPSSATVLISQLSIPTWDPTSTGKIKIESKESLRLRGVPSPDDAEALTLTFVPQLGEAGTSRLEGVY
jgi:hypothetical protein